MKSLDANGSIGLNEETFFSQMGALVYDMLNLEVSVEKVQTFVKAMCSTYGMIDLKSTLEQLVENVSRAIVLSEEGSLALTSSSTTTSSSSLSRQRRYEKYNWNEHEPWSQYYSCWIHETKDKYT